MRNIYKQDAKNCKTFAKISCEESQCHIRQFIWAVRQRFLRETLIINVFKTRPFPFFRAVHVNFIAFRVSNF